MTPTWTDSTSTGRIRSIHAWRNCIIDGRKGNSETRGFSVFGYWGQLALQMLLGGMLVDFLWQIIVLPTQMNGVFQNKKTKQPPLNKDMTEFHSFIILSFHYQRKSEQYFAEQSHMNTKRLLLNVGMRKYFFVYSFNPLNVYRSRKMIALDSG